MDLKKEIRNFVPIDIEKFSQNNDASEKIIDSVKLYNKAIGYLKTGSEDIAMIELKKVVSINPDFYEAVNLLGLCYAYTNQMDKAEALFGKAVQGDNNALKAADYLNYFNTGDKNSANKTNKTTKTNKIKKSTPEKKPNKVEKETKRRDGYNEESVQTEYFLLKKISSQLKKPSVVIIVNIFSIICLIVAMILFFSASKNPGKDKVASETTNIAKVTNSYNKVLAENKTLKSQLETANTKLKEIQLSSDLSQVSNVYIYYVCLLISLLYNP
jgi:tetratricopeptide (TPR) repeat protein